MAFWLDWAFNWSFSIGINLNPDADWLLQLSLDLLLLRSVTFLLSYCDIWMESLSNSDYWVYVTFWVIDSYINWLMMWQCMTVMLLCHSGIDNGLRGCEALQIIFLNSYKFVLCFTLNSPRSDPSDRVNIYTIKGPWEKFGFYQDPWARFEAFPNSG